MVGITGGSALSDYRSRSVVIDVAGMANSKISRVSNYQVKVPYSQLSTAIHRIACQGGKVVNVVVQGVAPQSQPSAPEVPQETPKKTSQKKKGMVPRSTKRKSRRAKKKS